MVAFGLYSAHSSWEVNVHRQTVHILPFVTGESYAGVYVPMLAQAIVAGNADGQKPQVSIQASLQVGASMYAIHMQMCVIHVQCTYANVCNTGAMYIYANVCNTVAMYIYACNTLAACCDRGMQLETVSQMMRLMAMQSFPLLMASHFSERSCTWTSCKSARAVSGMQPKASPHTGSKHPLTQ